SDYGTCPVTHSQEQLDLNIKKIKDTAVLFQLIAGQNNKDPMTLHAPIDGYLDHLTGDVNGLVIGVDENYFFENVDDDIEKAVKDDIRFLEENGAKVELVELSSLYDTEDLDHIPVFSEASVIHQEEF